MSASIHDKLDRVRPDRVTIRYDVETEGAVVQKELPFVVGVMGDFSGNPTQKLQPLSDRKYVQIDRDNFNEVMKGMTPGLVLDVENTLKGDGSTMKVNLDFGSLDDFGPSQVARKVEPLQKLLDTRDKLKELRTKIDKSDKLDELLSNVLQNTDELKKLAGELGVKPSGDQPQGSK